MENNIHKSTKANKDTEQYRTSLTIGMGIKDKLQMLADLDDRSLASYIRKVLTEHAEKANLILSTTSIITNNESETSKEVSNNNTNNEPDIREQDSTINSMAKIDTPHNQTDSNNTNNDGMLSFKLPTAKIKNNPF